MVKKNIKISVETIGISYPILIIGLGGLGIEIVRKINDHLPEMDIEGSKFAIHAFDTDTNSFDRKDKLQTELLCHEDIDVNSFFDETYPTDPIDSINNWINNAKKYKNFHLTNVRDGGTKGRRHVGRLAFYEAIKNKKFDGLKKSIDKFFKLTGERFGRPVCIRVMIVCSLGGGTGSGAALPLGLYIKEYTKNKYYYNNVTLCYSFILPELILHIKPDLNSYKDQLISNTNSSFKELNIINSATRSKKLGNIIISNKSINCCFLHDIETGIETDLEEIARIIYIPIFSQISNKILPKSSLSENKSFYHSAGTSILRYAKDEIVDYLAYRVTERNVNEWLSIDNKIKESTKADSAYEDEDFGKKYINEFEKLRSIQELNSIFEKFRSIQELNSIIEKFFETIVRTMTLTSSQKFHPKLDRSLIIKDKDMIKEKGWIIAELQKFDKNSNAYVDELSEKIIKQLNLNLSRKVRFSEIEESHPIECRYLLYKIQTRLQQYIDLREPDGIDYNFNDLSHESEELNQQIEIREETGLKISQNKIKKNIFSDQLTYINKIIDNWEEMFSHFQKASITINDAISKTKKYLLQNTVNESQEIQKSNDQLIRVWPNEKEIYDSILNDKELQKLNEDIAIQLIGLLKKNKHDQDGIIQKKIKKFFLDDCQRLLKDYIKNEDKIDITIIDVLEINYEREKNSNAQQVKTFLHYIKNILKIQKILARPMYNLSNSNSKIFWGMNPCCIDAFERDNLNPFSKRNESVICSNQISTTDIICYREDNNLSVKYPTN